MFHKLISVISNISVVFITTFLLFIPTYCNALVSPSSNFYVNDYANVLSEDTKNLILTNSNNLNNSNGIQIVVVTLNNLDGYSLEEYANELYDNFKIGSNNSGVLILVSIEDRASVIRVGYGLEGILNDSKTGRIQDNYMVPYFKEDKIDEGIRCGYINIYNEIALEYNLDKISDDSYIRDDSTNFVNSNNYIYIFLVLIVLQLVLNIIPIMNLSRKSKVVKISSSILILLLQIVSFYISYSTSNDLYFLIVFLISFIYASIIGVKRYGYSMYHGLNVYTMDTSYSDTYHGNGGKTGGGGSSRHW